MSMICTKIEFSNSQSTITGITLFPDEELFILALYFTLLQQPISIPMFLFLLLRFYYYFGLFCEVTFMISLDFQFFVDVLLEARVTRKQQS